MTIMMTIASSVALRSIFIGGETKKGLNTGIQPHLQSTKTDFRVNAPMRGQWQSDNSM